MGSWSSEARLCFQSCPHKNLFLQANNWISCLRLAHSGHPMRHEGEYQSDVNAYMKNICIFRISLYITSSVLMFFFNFLNSFLRIFLFRLAVYYIMGLAFADASL